MNSKPVAAIRRMRRMMLAKLAVTLSPLLASAAALEPLTLMRDGEIAGCGVTARSPAVDGDLEVGLRLMKVESAPTGATFVLSVRRRSSPLASVIRLELMTSAGATVGRFSKPQAASDGGFEARGNLGPLEGGELMRALMISGGRFEIETADGTAQVQIASPAPHATRAAYLNCAGDLFRPERAGR